MADQYINATGLQAIKTWIKGLFATKTEMQEVDKKVDDLTAVGAQPNVIESITVNGTAITPDAAKNVELNMPTKTSDLTNNGDGTSNFATEDFVNTHGGKIDVIKVNGTAQTITNKEVNIAMPTKVSDLQNDGDGTAGSAFATTAEVDSKISTAVTSAYKYKGSVATTGDLQTGATEGDVYNVEESGMNYAWDGTVWDPLGQLIDTSLLWAKDELTAMTVAEINAILEA